MEKLDYKPNSHKYKAESTDIPEKKVEKVVTNTVKTRKNNARKFTDVFISEDAASVKSYVVMDVLIPAIKKAISDIVTNGIDMILYGDSGRSRRSSNISHVSYRNYYDDRRDDRRDTRIKNKFDYDDLVFETRGDVEAIRERMDDIIDRYGFVTVADLYDMADLTAPYTSNKYGWTNIRNAEPVRVRDGYILKLPKAMPID